MRVLSGALAFVAATFSKAIGNQPASKAVPWNAYRSYELECSCVPKSAVGPWVSCTFKFEFQLDSKRHDTPGRKTSSSQQDSPSPLFLLLVENSVQKSAGTLSDIHAAELHALEPLVELLLRDT